MKDQISHKGHITYKEETINDIKQLLARNVQEMLQELNF